LEMMPSGQANDHNRKIANPPNTRTLIANIGPLRLALDQTLSKYSNSTADLQSIRLHSARDADADCLSSRAKDASASGGLICRSAITARSKSSNASARPSTSPTSTRRYLPCCDNLLARRWTSES